MFAFPAHAQFYYPALNTQCTGGTAGSCPQAGSGAAWCNNWLFQVNANGGTATLTGDTIPGAPTGVGIATHCTASSGANGGSPGAVAGSLGCSTSQAPLDLLTTLGGATGYTSTGAFCYNGCEYTNGNATLQVGTATNRFAGKAAPSGNVCGLAGNPSQAVSENSTCGSVNGVTTCGDGTDNVGLVSSALNGTFNVIKPDVPATPQTCVGYADGAVACNGGSSGVVQTPPGPSTSTNSSVAATPAAQVSETGVSSNIVNYYSAATVAASKGVVNSNVGVNGTQAGTSSGQGTNPAGTGTGSSGSGPGDCMLQPGESGADDPSGCTGTTPSLTRSDTVQSNIQALYSGIGTSPIVAALAAISSSVPSAGACPSATVTLTTLNNQSFNFLQTACTIFAADLSTLVAISDTVWCILGVLIVMSA